MSQHGPCLLQDGALLPIAHADRGSQLKPHFPAGAGTKPSPAPWGWSRAQFASFVFVALFIYVLIKNIYKKNKRCFAPHIH